MVYNIKMKITFKDNNKDIKGEVLFVSVDPKNKDEIIKENGIKQLNSLINGMNYFIA